MWRTTREQAEDLSKLSPEKLAFYESAHDVNFSLKGRKEIWHKIRKAKKHKKKNFRPMRKPFEISFDFPVALSDLKVALTATVEIHHSDLYFRVHDFHFKNAGNRKGDHSVLPEQEIRKIKWSGSHAWVHKDSEKASQLSQAIGAAIENALTKEELGVEETNE